MTTTSTPDNNTFTLALKAIGKIDWGTTAAPKPVDADDVKKAIKAATGNDDVIADLIIAQLKTEGVLIETGSGGLKKDATAFGKAAAKYAPTTTGRSSAPLSSVMGTPREPWSALKKLVVFGVGGLVLLFVIIYASCHKKSESTPAATDTTATTATSTAAAGTAKATAPAGSIRAEDAWLKDISGGESTMAINDPGQTYVAGFAEIGTPSTVYALRQFADGVYAVPVQTFDHPVQPQEAMDAIAAALKQVPWVPSGQMTGAAGSFGVEEAWLRDITGGDNSNAILDESKTKLIGYIELGDTSTLYGPVKAPNGASFMKPVKTYTGRPTPEQVFADLPK